jgi:hypothetical protein
MILPAFLLICEKCGSGGPIPGFPHPQGIEIRLPPGWKEKSSAIQVAGQPPKVSHDCPECAAKAEKPTIVTP